MFRSTITCPITSLFASTFMISVEKKLSFSSAYIFSSFFVSTCSKVRIRSFRRAISAEYLPIMSLSFSPRIFSETAFTNKIFFLSSRPIIPSFIWLIMVSILLFSNFIFARLLCSYSSSFSAMLLKALARSPNSSFCSR